MAFDTSQDTESIAEVVQSTPRGYMCTPFNLKNLGYATNSCYITATISACFASWNAFDTLLVAPTSGSNTRTELLRNTTKKIVNQMRLGSTVSSDDVDLLRRVLGLYGFPKGREQEDVTEFFSVLMDRLDAPLLALYQQLMHVANPDEHDERFVLERFIWLAFENCSNRPTNLSALLRCSFFGEVRAGLRRQSIIGQLDVNAFCHRLLLPKYTIGTPSKSGHTKNSFSIRILPLALKRYGNRLRKIRTPVWLPLTFDFNDFVKLSSSHLSYTLHMKSVLCHLGPGLGSGHYVSFTHDVNGWRRWDSLGAVNVELGAEAADGLPMNPKWREEIMCDSYLMFYELIPGDGSLHLTEKLAPKKNQNSMEHGYEPVNDLFKTCLRNEMAVRYEQVKADAEYARLVQEGGATKFSSGNSIKKDNDGLQREKAEQTALETQIKNDQEIARAVQKETVVEFDRDNQMRADERLASTVRENLIEYERLSQIRADGQLAMAMRASAEAFERDNQIRADEELARLLSEFQVE